MSTNLTNPSPAEVRPIANRASPPTLIQYDQLGRRVDDLQTCEAWRTLKAIAQEEGIVAIQYERKEGAYSRVYSFAKQIIDAIGILSP